MDLIDREKATKLINEILIDISNGKIELHEQVLQQLAINITCIPPADTERHAHWIVEEAGKYYARWKCSNCGCYHNWTSFEKDIYYCGCCGCRMDEVEE